MIRSCVRQAVRAFAGAAFFSCALAANAGGITLSDSNCDSFSLSGPAGSQVLTCVVSNAPANCSIQGPSTGTNGNQITLTAVCSTGSPTSYVWTGGSCANNTTQSCQAVGTDQTVTYGVTPSNAIGPGNTATKQVVWSAATAVKPSQCSISADVNPLPVGGGTVNLTAQCGGGDPVDTWVWTGPVTTSSGNTASASISASTGFSVTPTNGGGSASASLTVGVSTGGGGAISCSGFNNTNVVNAIWPNWPNPTGGLKMPMGSLDALVVKFTTGSTTSSQTGKIVLFSGSGQDSAHDAVVSTTPCDFTTNIMPNGFKFTIGTKVGSVTVLQPNTTYYVNIKNSAGAICIAGAFPCDLFMNLVKPSGT